MPKVNQCCPGARTLPLASARECPATAGSRTVRTITRGRPLCGGGRDPHWCIASCARTAAQRGLRHRRCACPYGIHLQCAREPRLRSASRSAWGPLAARPAALVGERRHSGSQYRRRIADAGPCASRHVEAGSAQVPGEGGSARHRAAPARRHLGRALTSAHSQAIDHLLRVRAAVLTPAPARAAPYTAALFQISWLRPVLWLGECVRVAPRVDSLRSSCLQRPRPATHAPLSHLTHSPFPACPAPKHTQMLTHVHACNLQACGYVHDWISDAQAAQASPIGARARAPLKLALPPCSHTRRTRQRRTPWYLGSYFLM